jgi:hypothetical protein
MLEFELHHDKIKFKLNPSKLVIILLNKICFKSSKQLSTNFTQRYDHIIRFDSSASSVNGGSFHNTNKGYQNDTLNLYFMHPNENVDLVLVTSLLSGSNYHLWSRSMTIEL